MTDSMIAGMNLKSLSACPTPTLQLLFRMTREAQTSLGAMAEGERDLNVKDIEQSLHVKIWSRDEDLALILLGLLAHELNARPRVAGVCRFCGCTEFVPCIIYSFEISRPCAWADRSETVCDEPACIQASHRRRAKKGRAA
jgi:hypothetical protein